MPGQYINEPGFEVEANKIIVVPLSQYDESYKDVILPLVGQGRRDWFDPHFYYCLPLNIGNQYGFAIKSLYDVTVVWDGSLQIDGVKITIDNDQELRQHFTSGFGHGILTIQNNFHLKTPPGINLMTIQTPNYFIPGLSAMTGVIETDNIRRDFTFNLKITEINKEIKIKKGEMIAAFLPIPRNFVENFKIESVFDNFPINIYGYEIEEGKELAFERNGEDKNKTHLSGRRYFKGIHTDGTEYKNHQKKLL